MSLRDQGAQALKSGNPQAALPLLAQAVQQNPQDPQTHAYLGTAYAQLGQFEKAVQSLAQASRLAPQSAAIHFNLAMALEKAGRGPEALAAYRQVLALDGAHERARQAVARLGGAAAPPASAAPAAAPAPPGSGLGEFALGPAPSAPAAPAPSVYGTPPPQSGAPAPAAAAPASPYGAPPPAYAAPPAPAGPPGGMQPLGNWNPPAPAAPTPMGMQPLGEWTPPPGAPAPAGAMPPPSPYGPPLATSTVVEGSAVLSRVDNDAGLSRTAFMGNSYLAGMAMGVWWGLLGAVVVFFTSLTQITASEMGEHMPRILVTCLMMLAGGAMLYAIVGLIASTTDDPEKFGGILGIAVGLMTAIFLMPIVMASIGFYSIGGLFGTTWVSWKMGAVVGAGVAEQQASALVVAGPGSVVVARTR